MKIPLVPKLKNLFSHRFKADIWRMEPDVAARQLALELRDGDVMEVSFGLIELRSESEAENSSSGPRLLWDELSFDSGWWTGLYGLHKGIMLLYTYEDQQNPEQKSVFALDVKHREVIWAYSAYNHLIFEDDYSLGFSGLGEERSYAKIELKTGLLSNLSDEEGLTALQKQRAKMVDESSLFVYPLHYSAENPHFARVQEFLKEREDIEAVQACEYLEIFDKIIISYYTANREKLSNHILVMGTDGEPLLHDMLKETGEGVALDTFFVLGRKLIFIKEKRTIECYEI